MHDATSASAQAINYDLNAERPLPRVLKVLTDILPEPWCMFCRKNKIRLYVLIGYENEAENIKIWPASNIFARMIARGEHLGKKKAGDSSSGNFVLGAGKALKAIRKRDSNFPVEQIVACVPRNLERPKLERLEEEGIEIEFANDSMHAMERIAELCEKHGWLYFRQYWNKDNSDTYGPIARHVAKLLPHLGVFAAGIGSGGLFSGMAPTLKMCFANRGFPIQRAAILVEVGSSSGGMRTAPATEPGSLEWRGENVEDTRFINNKDSLVFSSALWRQKDWSPDGDACFGGESTGSAGLGTMLALENLAIQRKLDRHRGPDEYVHALFVSADTRKPYRANYEKHGIFLPEQEWNRPYFTQDARQIPLSL